MTIIDCFVQNDLHGVQALARACGVYVPDGREAPLLVVREGAEIAAFAAWRCVLDEAELLAIAVREIWRGQGIGARLLQAGLAALPEVRSVFLEVRAANHAAQALYRRHGFVENGRRRGYYGDDDALLMQWRRAG